MSVAHKQAGGQPLDISRVRADFPVFEQQVHGKPLAYLDSAASTQKPRQVTEAVMRYYERDCSNVHRGLHQLSARATEVYEGAREASRAFINAADPCEIVFTSGTTGAINLVARAWGDRFVGEGDRVLITEMEHHSNIIPWQLLCERSGAALDVIPIDDSGALRLDALDSLLGPRTRLLALSHTSNALGTRNPLKRLIESAHARGVPVLVDAAQAMAHERVDVQELGCEFLTFSGHKMLGPTGIGVLYGKEAVLRETPPFLGGGEMIHSVSFSGSTYKGPPHRFEAGTPNIAGAYGLSAAMRYLETTGVEAIGRHEHELLDYATQLLEQVPGLRIIGTAPDKAGIVSFVIDGIHPHDAGTVIDLEGVAVRAGHHCAQPVMEHFGIPATVRASIGCYNTREDIDALMRGIERTIEVLG